MGASRAFDLTAARRPVPRWTIGRRTALALVGIVILAIVSFVLTAILIERVLNAQNRVARSHEVQLKIDEIVWDILVIQEATRAYTISGDPDQAIRFDRFQTEIGDDIASVTQLTKDNPHQQELIASLATASGRYLADVRPIFALRRANDLDRARALALSADASGLSSVVAKMREHEDERLEGRAKRQKTFSLVVYPSLLLSGLLIALLVGIAAASINRSTRAQAIALSDKDGLLASKDMLMREVDHRVRNNLGLIYNLMTFKQRRTRGDAIPRSYLAEAANQVLTVARMHERLYKSGAANRIEIGGYVRDLCEDVAAFSLATEARAAIQVRAVDSEVASEHAIWLGLIVAELVTNALKYANPTAQSPIVVEIEADDSQLRVIVSDRGAGLPASFDPLSSGGLGMQIVCLLVRQLRASLAVDTAWSGARFVVTVPVASVSGAGAWVERARRAG
jgi:two-component sensor histidine kinase